MLMYGQDELGSISDDLIAEIANRLGLNNVQVEETLAFYSMLHRKPIGKHHVQGVHQRGLYAARRNRTSGTCQEAAGNRAQGSYEGRGFLAGRSGVHWGLYRCACDPGEL